MAGVIFFNPILGRRNIPGMVKVGLSLSIAVHAAYGLAGVSLIDYTAIELVFSMIKEFAAGFVMGFIVQLFLSVFHLGGELIDMQMGLSMANMYDPTSNSQISVHGNLLTLMYTMLFFISDSHMNLLAIAIQSFQVVPMGLAEAGREVGMHVTLLFGYILVYAVQLALPMIIVEMVAEVAVGILMRVVPNINVFVVNLQLKIGIGIVVILTLIPVLVKYMGKLNLLMLGRLEEILLLL
jgi:flagellar biosynthetic protein FliR